MLIGVVEECLVLLIVGVEFIVVVVDDFVGYVVFFCGVLWLDFWFVGGSVVIGV